MKKKPINFYKCCVCRKPASFYVGLKKVCSIECRDALIKKECEKAKKEREKRQRKKQKEDEFRIKSLLECCNDAQRDFNKLIVTIDRSLGYTCIARPELEVEHAGHYVHAGSQYKTSWLRFMHFNVHGQSLKSNFYGDSNESDRYENGVIERYGQDYFDAIEQFKILEKRNDIPAPTKDEVVKMAKWCRQMTKIYERRASNV
tara:strand:- start:1013 stop:1618 length:606 start_codon:yes stop_codon:yes gene_type:complete